MAFVASSALGLAAVAGGTALVGGYMSSKAQSKAADRAADAQMASSEMGVQETRRQFDAMQAMMKPYTEAGTGALTGQQNLLGLNGNDAQAQAISGIENSSQFGELAQQGENAMLQNAAATGGLRGGNLQAALAQFRPQMLNQMIQQQYANLGGLTSMGQNSAAGVGNAGMQTGANIATLYGQQGQAQAGAALAKGQAQGQFINTATNAFGTFLGAKF